MVSELSKRLLRVKRGGEPFLALCEVSLGLLGLALFSTLSSASAIHFTLVAAGHSEEEGRKEGKKKMDLPMRKLSVFGHLLT